MKRASLWLVVALAGCAHVGASFDATSLSWPHEGTAKSHALGTKFPEEKKKVDPAVAPTAKPSPETLERHRWTRKP